RLTRTVNRRPTQRTTTHEGGAHRLRSGSEWSQPARSHDEAEYQQLLGRLAVEGGHGQRSTDVVVQACSSDHRELVDQARGDHALDDDLALGEEVGSGATLPGRADGGAGHLPVTDRL